MRGRLERRAASACRSSRCRWRTCCAEENGVSPILITESSAYPNGKKFFVHHLKASTQRVSVVLRRPTSDAVLVFNQVAKAYSAVPLGVVAAAPLEGAAEGDNDEEDEEAE